MFSILVKHPQFGKEPPLLAGNELGMGQVQGYLFIFTKQVLIPLPEVVIELYVASLSRAPQPRDSP